MTQVLLDELANGQWREQDLLVAQAALSVHPAGAFRHVAADRAEEAQNWSAERRGRVIARGKRAVITGTVRSLVRTGMLEQRDSPRGKELRLSPARRSAPPGS